MRRIGLLLGVIALSAYSYGQGCCSGGGGNPLAGNTSTGVLGKNQMEVRSSYQYSSSGMFLSGDRDTVPYFDNLSSDYLFFKVDYGVTERFTMSVASGYFLDRSIREFPIGDETEARIVSSSGFGDLIILPRMNVFTKQKGSKRTELTVGLGMKIPLGINNDSSSIGYSYFLNMDGPQPFIDSVEIWQTLPPTIQTTTGSNDLMLFANYLRAYNKINMRVFLTGFYVRKGWNSLGQKFGDFATLTIAADKTVYKNFGAMVQLGGEWTGLMKTTPAIDQLATYGIDPSSTGSYKVSVLPQLRYSFKRGLTLFANMDIPLYQYMRGTQIAAKHQITAGLNYSFYLSKKSRSADTCAIDRPDFTQAVFKVWGNCDMCREKIEKTVMSLKGVDFAKWEATSNMLTVYYDESRITTDRIKLELAEVGYDTDTHRSSDKVYENLPACCKYERPD